MFCIHTNKNAVLTVDSLQYNVYHITVKYFDWDDDKNKWLMLNRGISFELCMQAIEKGDILAHIQNKPPREHQQKITLLINNYAYVLIFVEDKEKIFFKTVYPSHKETKKYLSYK